MPGKFRTTIKGYNINEVNSFVDKVTAEYEALLEKLKVSDEENKKLKLELEKYANIETSLKNALLIYVSLLPTNLHRYWKMLKKMLLE